MIYTQTIPASSIAFSADIALAIAQYRHKIFIERLGWSLPVENGIERDQFDRTDTVYVIARNAQDEICGCARLLPTTRPYLLSEVFPHLLSGLPMPSNHEIWELSRFAAANVSTNTEDPETSAANTRRLLAAAVASAARYGAKRLITVSPLGIERLLNRMGVHAHRASPPKLAEGKLIFACWIEIDQQTMSALGIQYDAIRYEETLYQVQ
jgi:acyl homoserine lactone synthase